MSSSALTGDVEGRPNESHPRPTSSRPTTPLRSTSRASLRAGQAYPSASHTSGASSFPLDAFEPAFAELSDSMADLEANFMHLQLMHESLSRFNENFASFLYGLNMNAFCVDFPEAPIRESYKRFQQQDAEPGRSSDPEKPQYDFDPEATFMTTDTSFVDHPPASSRVKPKFAGPEHQSKAAEPATRGARGASGRGTRTATSSTRGSVLARARGRYSK